MERVVRKAQSEDSGSLKFDLVLDEQKFPKVIQSSFDKKCQRCGTSMTMTTPAQTLSSIQQ